MPSPLHYSDYLQLSTILNAQLPESDNAGVPAHDEMLFIIIHQTYELWFKQLLYEIDDVASIMSTPVNDNSPALQTVVHQLSRCVKILKVLVHQVDIMETMTPMDFLDFRDRLRPASGFQSWQFKVLEARLGLKYNRRHGADHYISQLNAEEITTIKDAEQRPTLLELVNGWLERMPFFDEGEHWTFNEDERNPDTTVHPFWKLYRQKLGESLAAAEQSTLSAFDNTFMQDVELAGERGLSARACRSALFIMLYRGFAVLQLPFQLLQQLLDIDEQLSTWRYRHMSMVQRVIGLRMGTGGSTGRDYLRSATEKHYVFAEIAQLSSFLIERKKLPSLPLSLERRLGFIGG